MILSGENRNIDLPIAARSSIRLACRDDVESIGELLPELGGPLYGERFPGKTSADFCNWKYFTNPAGDAIVGLALDHDRVVSVVAGTPKRIWLGNRTELAFELGDFITVPAYRKRGYFSSLIELVGGSAREMGAAFLYVRPNEISFPILVSRLGFHEQTRMDSRRYRLLSGVAQRKFGIPSRLIRALGVDWLISKLALPKSSGRVAIEPLLQFDDEVTELWEKTRDRYSFCLVRDREYLNWRYIDCPTPYRVWAARRSGELAGYLVAFSNCAQPLSTIVDLFADPDDDDTAAALLEAAIRDLESAGTQVVETWTLQDHTTSASTRHLARACLFKNKQPLHLAMRFLNDDTDPSTLPLSGWQFNAGDFDGI